MHFFPNGNIIATLAAGQEDIPVRECLHPNDPIAPIYSRSGTINRQPGGQPIIPEREEVACACSD
jgi:hypothetical protein